jgi:hypothetical protein
MGRKQLARERDRENLAHIEDAARTEADFKAVIAHWNRLDQNRERRERDHEIGRSNEEMLYWEKVKERDEKGKTREGLNAVIPHPLDLPWWRQLMRGDFIDTIYDNALEMWQFIEDWDIASLVKTLSDKQKKVLFSRAVRLCTSAQVAWCHDKTDRAVRKLLVAALDSIRDKLSPIIREQVDAGLQQMTPAKREFLAWYENEKAAALDSGKDE